MKKIAIIGAGFAGLALAYFLKDHAELNLFDAKSPHAGSTVAHGLCHPFVGQKALLNGRGREGMKRARELFDAASQAAGKQLYQSNGIARFALDEEQRINFKEAAAKYPDLKWFEKEDSPYPSCHYPGIFIQEGLFVAAERYLDSMKQLLNCKVEERTLSRGELTGYDAVVFAVGGDAKRLFPEVPLRLIKGQLIQLPFSGSLPFPLMSKKYLAQEGAILTVGATYERTFTSLEPEPALASEELLSEAVKLLPELEGAPILKTEAGVRCFTPARVPLFKEVRKNEWLFTGFGSKGLLYHALYAEEAAKELLSSCRG